jgi:hypothetical protein
VESQIADPGAAHGIGDEVVEKIMPPRAAISG